MLYTGPSTAAQNKAHRDDLTWIKVGKSEYMRSDGITIRKDNRTGRWFAFNEDGSKLMDARHNFFHVSGHSLTWAKIEVENNA